MLGCSISHQKDDDDVLFTLVYTDDEHSHWKITSEIIMNNQLWRQKKRITINQYIFHFIILPFFTFTLEILTSLSPFIQYLEAQQQEDGGRD